MTVFAQAEMQFKRQYKYEGRVKTVVQKTYPAYVQNGRLLGNPHSTFGRTGHASIYDSKGLKQSQIFDDGETRFPVEFQYERSRRCITAQAYYVDGDDNRLWKTAHFEYDTKRKHVIHQVVISANGDTLECTSYHYKKQQLKEETYCNYKDADTKYLSEYTYNMQGEVSRIAYYTLVAEEKKLESSDIFTYDDKGNIKSKINHDAQGKPTGAIINHRYEYDEVGNWIRRETYENEEVYSLTEREFEYQ